VETDEDLETGYGPAAAAGDNLCNDYVQGLAAAFTSLARARGDRDHSDDALAMVDAGSPSPFGNVVAVTRPIDAAGWPSLAETMHAFYSGRPGGAFLVFSAWPTPDLAGLDFGRIGHPPLMFRPPGPIPAVNVAGLEIEEVAGRQMARDWEYTLVHGFPEPALQPFREGCFLPEHALGAAGWRHWVGYLYGEPAGTASAYVGRHHVDVEFIATMPAARRAGIGRALTAVATRAAPQLPAMLISSDLGRRVYQRLGYMPLLRFTLWAGHRRDARGLTPQPSPQGGPGRGGVAGRGPSAPLGRWRTGPSAAGAAVPPGMASQRVTSSRPARQASIRPAAGAGTTAARILPPLRRARSTGARGPVPRSSMPAPTTSQKRGPVQVSAAGLPAERTRTATDTQAPRDPSR